MYNIYNIYIYILYIYVYICVYIYIYIYKINHAKIKVLHTEIDS